MADDHDPSNDVNENDDGGEFDYDEPTTIAPVAPPAAQPVQTAATSLLDEDYEDDEPIEDYVVNLVVNEKPDGLPSGFGDAVTDRYGNTIYDSLNAASTAVYDELNGNGTGITGGKRWFGKFIKLKLATTNETERERGEKRKKREISAYVCVCKCVYALATYKR